MSSAATVSQEMLQVVHKQCAQRQKNLSVGRDERNMRKEKKKKLIKKRNESKLRNVIKV